MFGYHNKILIIDVSTKSWRWEDLQEEVVKDFIGGSGLGAYLLYHYCPPGADPFSPANPLIFCASPLVGSRLTTTSKFAVVSKSPQTGFIGDSLSSSSLALSIKGIGADAVIILGSSSQWLSLKVDESGIQFNDASHLLGNTTSMTEGHLIETFGPGYGIACIGPAGENMVRFASISNDGGRQAGRTGNGAVMGSKKIKAISFKGYKKLNYFNELNLSKTRKQLAIKSLGEATEKYRTLGTMANLSVFERLKVLPIGNFRNQSNKDFHSISGEAIHNEEKVSTSHCANCTIGCEKLVTIPNGGSAKVRLEYQSLFALGPLVGISDRETILKSSKFCDEMGMDTISAGSTCAWFMECMQKGLLPKQWLELLPTYENDEDLLKKLLNAIAKRSGIGDILAEGSARVSKEIGLGTEDFAMHVKGLEMPGYEPRSLHTMALALAVSTRGACHNRSSAYEYDFASSSDSGKLSRGQMVVDGEDYSAVMDSLIWCKFVRKVFDDFYVESSEILNDVTGWDMDPNQLARCGERINNLKKQFNIREGWVMDQDNLPQRIFSEPLSDGENRQSLSESDLGTMIKSYYDAREWTSDGLIPESKLKSLGIEC